MRLMRLPPLFKNKEEHKPGFVNIFRRENAVTIYLACGLPRISCGLPVTIDSE